MKTLNVVVGSMNPVKVNAVQKAMSQLYPEHKMHCRGIKAPSGVADQPMTSKSTREGALNRALFCKQQSKPEDRMDYFIAFEGGVDLFEDGPATFAYVAILHHEKQSVGCSARLPLPRSIYNDLADGKELGHVMDQRFHTHNIKQQGGAIGLLTNNNATRTSTYTEALILAMAPFLHPDQY
ncbi:inosine/xanthosine triphosphatase [Marinomonas sp. 15G1-11]|uniref:Inosine/xanthosine triphosphatase n=1 Tax=Marinomonas phaeophyticola TaxID=3004091 RepID=A0ABT4JY58_9GAMM|nr:inosine/xanthosine triphosphatase [Marinomonas sp. 15G1-11]MCZ2723166.1 inosine/xanthosine triphosphatase [Marinomonas sp. 15G1-11]